MIARAPFLVGAALAVGLVSGYALRSLREERTARETFAAELASSRSEVEELRRELELALAAGGEPGPESARVPLEAAPAPVERPRPRPVEARAAQPEIPDVAAARARLAELLAAGEPDREVEQLLRRLKELGTPEAIGFMLEIMEMPEVTTARNMLFAELLADVDDARIQQVSLRVLRRNVEEGLSSWFDTWGYIDLVGQRSDAESAAYLLELMRAGGQAGHRAGTFAKELLPFATSAEILAIAESSPGMAGEVYDSLASSGDPRVHEELLALCQASADPAAGQKAEFAAEALGKWLEPERFAQELGALRSGSDADLALAMAFLRGAGSNSKGSPEFWRSTGLPVLEQALTSAELAGGALETLESDERYHAPETVALLERLLPSAPAELRGPMKKTLATLRRAR